MDAKKQFGRLMSDVNVKKVPPDPIEDVDEEDVGPCAAIAKDKWVSALTIKCGSKPSESFQYRGLATRSVFEPTTFWVQFLDDDEKWKITVTGRNLERIYNLTIQHRMEWIRAAERDFAEDGKPIILSIVVEPVEEPKT